LQRQVAPPPHDEDAERASVVVTNPTHYGRALEYRADMAAPAVVAKGQNLLAASSFRQSLARDSDCGKSAAGAGAFTARSKWARPFPPKLYAVVAESAGHCLAARRPKPKPRHKPEATPKAQNRAAAAGRH